MKSSRALRNLELQGFIDEEGTLERRLPIDQWWVPREVRLKGSGLVWRFDLGRYVSSGPGLLADFLQLGDASDLAICGYAKKWGVLQICKLHNLPASHNVASPPSKETAWFCQCKLRLINEGRGLSYGEPCEAWRKYARQAQAILSLAAQLREGNPGPLQDWQVLRPKKLIEEWLTDKGSTKNQKVFEGRLQVSFELKTWLGLGNVGFAPYWGEADPIVLFGNRRLFGALALQLLFTVSRTEGFAFCSSCGQCYPPEKRRPRPDQRRYCKRCKKVGRDKADASRDYWRRRHLSVKSSAE